MDRLKDKVAIITGADGGICHKASELFFQEGAKVVMVDIDPAVEAKCAEIVANGGDAIAIVADVKHKENWEIILKQTIEKYGKVNICVNGAAHFSMSGDWNSNQSMDEWDLVMETNLKSMYWSYQVVLQYMLDNELQGSFLNFASSTALSWMGAGCQAYPITKAGIMRTTMNMVKYNSEKGIRFNCLAPNCVWTPKEAFVYEGMGSWFEEIIPMGHIGEAEDAAWAMVYLCSDEAKYVNGVCLPIDGGWSTCN